MSDREAIQAQTKDQTPLPTERECERKRGDRGWRCFGHTFPVHRGFAQSSPGFRSQLDSVLVDRRTIPIPISIPHPPFPPSAHSILRTPLPHKPIHILALWQSPNPSPANGYVLHSNKTQSGTPWLPSLSPRPFDASSPATLKRQCPPRTPRLNHRLLLLSIRPHRLGICVSRSSSPGFISATLRPPIDQLPRSTRARLPQI